jgi:hypothetical protein
MEGNAEEPRSSNVPEPKAPSGISGLWVLVLMNSRLAPVFVLIAHSGPSWSTT